MKHGIYFNNLKVPQIRKPMLPLTKFYVGEKEILSEDKFIFAD